MSLQPSSHPAGRSIASTYLALLLALAACSLRPYTFGESATDTGGTTSPPTATTTGEDPTTGATDTTTSASSSGGATSSDTSPGTSSSSTASFVPGPPDVGGISKECDPWIEDCPEGQKCMPYSADGDLSWESTRCVDIVPGPDGVGEPCQVFGPPTSGEDTCDKHALCWKPDPDTGVGTCYAMCLGSPDAPSCADPHTACLLSSSAVLILCFPSCDPLMPDCHPVETCIPHPQSSQHFLCIVDSSGDEGQVFDPCEYTNACDPGLFCTTPMVAAECDPMAIGCCIPFCDINQPNTCPGQGQQCVPWYQPGDAPPGLDHVGACVLPAP